MQRILRHSSITVTTGTYVGVIEAVQRDALDSKLVRRRARRERAALMSESHCRQLPSNAPERVTKNPHMTWWGQ